MNRRNRSRTADAYTSPNPCTAYDDRDEARSARADSEHEWHERVTRAEAEADARADARERG